MSRFSRPSGRLAPDLHLAGADDVEPVAGLALGEDDVRRGRTPRSRAPAPALRPRAGSTPWKIPARIRTSSTAPLLVRPVRRPQPDHRRASLWGSLRNVRAPITRRSVERSTSRDRNGPIRSGSDLAPPGRTPAARRRGCAAGTARARGRCPDRNSAPTSSGRGLLEELLELVLAHGGLAQPGLHALHAQGEEHHQQRHEDGQPGSHVAVDRSRTAAPGGVPGAAGRTPISIRDRRPSRRRAFGRGRAARGAVPGAGTAVSLRQAAAAGRRQVSVRTYPRARDRPRAALPSRAAAAKLAAPLAAGEPALGRARRVGRMLRELAADPPRRALRAGLHHAARAGRRHHPVRAVHRQAGQRGHPDALRPLPHAPPTTPAADRAELEELIRPTGFFRNKTDSLIGLGQALVERYDGDVPRHARRAGRRCPASAARPRTSSSATPSASRASPSTRTSGGWSAAGAGRPRTTRSRSSTRSAR